MTLVGHTSLAVAAHLWVVNRSQLRDARRQHVCCPRFIPFILPYRQSGSIEVAEPSGAETAMNLYCAPTVRVHVINVL